MTGMNLINFDIFYYRFALVSRPDEIDIEYKDVSGSLHIGSAKGLLSRLIQHEIEHLDGMVLCFRIL